MTTRFAVLALMALAIAAPAAAGCDDDDRPPVPHSVRANPLGSGGIMLQWSGLNWHYDITIRDAEGRGVPEAPDIVGGAPNKNYLEFFGLKPDKEYVFTVRARTEGGTQGCVSKSASDPVSARTDTADTNSFCSSYAKKAIKQVNDLRAKGCEHPGHLYDGPWSVNEGTHFTFCLEQKRNRKTGYEDAQKERDNILPQCTIQADQCKKYRDAAVKAVKENKDLKCGKTGGRWSEDKAWHYTWCMSVPRKSKEPGSETEKREKALAECRSKKAKDDAASTGGGSGAGACPVPDEWADMLAAHNELRAQYCGAGAPLSWNCDLVKGAQAFADKCECGHSNTPGVGENLAVRSIDPEKFPAGPDREAFDTTWACEKDLYDFNNPVIVGGFKKNCLPKEQGGEGVNGHFAQVVWKSMTQLGCARAKCPRRGDNCTIIPDKTQTNWVCWYRGFDSEGKSFGAFGGPLADNVQKPPQCGKAFHSRSTINCLRGMVLTSSGVCACPPGRRWNGRTCAPRRIISTPTPPPTPTGTGTCPRDRPVGTPPNCCPAGMTFDGSVCRAPKATTPPPACTGDRPNGTYPNCCPSGTFYSDGKCRPGGTNGTQPGGTNGPPRCTGDRPNGTFPNCCPSGTFYSDGKCRPGGTNGTQPGGTDGAQKGGTKPCPQGMTGTPPNCCPPGTRFQNGKCVRPQPTGPGNGGTKPCPPGTHATRSGGCEQNASPTTKPTPTPPPPKCSGGRRGTPPNCFCTGGRRFIGGRCRSIPKPTPTGPSPAKKCPEGMKGPKCDQVIVH